MVVGLYGKNTKELPPLRKQKLSKKAQEEYDNIKRELYTVNKNSNDWKFQFNQNKIKWVNPRSKIKREKIYSVPSKKTILIKIFEKSNWVGHPLPK